MEKEPIQVKMTFSFTIDERPKAKTHIGKFFQKWFVLKKTSHIFVNVYKDENNNTFYIKG